MTANNKDPHNRKLGAYPSEFEVLREKSIEELAKAKAKLPGRIKAAGSILNQERRKKALQKLLDESNLLDRVLREVTGSQKGKQAHHSLAS